MKFNIETHRHHVSKVIVEKGIRKRLTEYIGELPPNYFVFIDEHVNAIFRAELTISLGSDTSVHFATIPSGETSKSLLEFERLSGILLENGIRRNSMIIAIGGGVVGDLAGFVAASVHRGLRLIHVPTTLLAMVDSSIGGKTGINHITGKNLIGAFYQAETVLIDPEFLSTLPAREWNCGFGEVLKYACIADPDLFGRIGTISSWNEVPSLENLISNCARIKAEIVVRDELEAGERAFLNYGHTFAHALEQVTAYSRFAHGEAVYVGLVAATWLSAQLGAPVEVDQLLKYRKLFNLKTSDLTGSIEELIDVMHRDKKMNDQTLKLILLDSFGSPKRVSMNDYTLLRESWSFSLQTLNCS